MSAGYNEALSALQELDEHDKLSPFLVGDVIVALCGERRGHWALLKQLASDLGHSLSWVRQRHGVSEFFPPGVRAELWGADGPPPPVGWSHHRAAWHASVDAAAAQAWIRKAIDEQMSVRQLREAMIGLDPDHADDIVISWDAKAAELHIQLREGRVVRVLATGVPGLSRSVDNESRTVHIHAVLPADLAGRKLRVKQTR
jgi:hypothetical protein